MQAFGLGIREFHTFAKTPVCFQVGLHLFPSELVAEFFVQRLDVFAIGFGTHALVTQYIGVEFIRTATQRYAAGFVVGCDDNERFVGVLFVKFVGHSDGLIHVDYFVENSGSIVAVASPVDFSTLNHEEETVFSLLRKKLDAGTGNLLQRKVRLFAVNGVGQRGTVGFAGFLGLKQNHFLRLGGLLLKLLVATHQGVASLAAFVVERGRIVFFAGGLHEIRTGIEVETGFHEVLTYGVIRAATALVGIECSRGGVVNAHTGAYANRGSGLRCPLGHARYLGFLIGQHTECPIARFVSGSQCGSGRSRVGYAVRGRIGGDEGGIGKLREAKRSDTDAAFECCQISLGAVYLIHAHTVANEVEHVFGFTFGPNSHAEGKEHAKG